jgi:AcrR family transcriptional regulator
VSRRERGKDERRARILDAAEALIRADGEVSFSMRTLADRAGLSLATPFNLFGSKTAVLVALVDRALDAQAVRLAAARGLEPIERVIALGERGVRAYTRDEAFYRPLFGAIAEVSSRGAPPGLLERATDLWREALRDADAAGLLDARFDLELLARLLHLQFRAALLNWAAREIDGGAWLLEVRYGLSVVMLGAVTETVRPRLHEVVQRTQRSLARALARSRATQKESDRDVELRERPA